MEQPAEEIKRLQGCINDLISVLALPAIWSDRESSQIVSTLLEVLLGMLRLDFAYARLSDSVDGAPIEVVRLAQRRNLAAQPQEVGRALNRWLAGDSPPSPVVVPNPVGAGEVSVVPLPLGLQDEIGVLVAGSQRVDFPTEIERLLLRVAANQAAIGLQEARRLSEQRRAAEEIRFQAGLLDAVDQGVIATDTEGIITYWNRFAERLYGWSAPEVIGRNILDVTRAQGSPRAAAEMLSRWQQGERWTGEFLVQHREGRIFPVLVTASPIYNSQEVLIGVVEVSIDITERKRAEEALEQRVAERTSQLTAVNEELRKEILERQRAEEELRKSEERYAFVMTAANDGHFDWDLATDRIYLSPRNLELYGFSPSESFPTMSAWINSLRFYPGDKERREAALRDHLEGRSARYEVEFRVLLTNGEYRWVCARGQCLRDDHGHPYRMAGSVSDITARKRAEEELRRSEAYLAAGQRLSHTGSWAWNVAAGENVFWSQEHFRIYGFDAALAAVPSQAARERIHPDDRPCFDQALDSAIRERADVELTHRLVLPDGSMKYIHTLGHPVVDESGELLEYIGTVMDVTERRRAEEEREQLLAREQAALAEAEAAQHRFRDLVNSIEGIVWEADAGTFTFSFVSKQVERVLGYPVERWLNEPTFWKDHIYPDDREWAVNFCVTATAENRDHAFEYRMIAADGRIVWLRDLVTVVVEGDRATRLRGVMFDVTERKRAEEALRKSERQFHALFDEAAIGIALLNSAGHPFQSNRTLQQMLGYSGEEFRNMLFTQVTHPDDVSLDSHLFTELITGQREYYHIEKRYYGKDGRLVWGNLTVSLVRDESGEPLFGIGMVEDITERKRAEEALRQTQGALAHLSRVMTVGELTASIAHEVNQPLAGVVTNGNACLRWLDRQVPDLEEARAAVERIIRDGHRASEVIRRIRALSKKTDPQTALLTINDVIHEVIALVQSEVRKHRVALWTDLSSALPLVLGDRIQLQQVILNLLFNGIEAMQAVTDRVRELQIRSYRHASDAVGVMVRDVGIGLDPENMARLFDAFFTTKPGGMGIGLSISRTIIEAHGGRLWATANDGHGATFQFILPAGSERVS